MYKSYERNTLTLIEGFKVQRAGQSFQVNPGQSFEIQKGDVVEYNGKSDLTIMGFSKMGKAENPAPDKGKE